MFSGRWYRSLLLSLCITISFVYADSWKILLYMDSSDNLSEMAIKNITDAVRGKPAENIELFVQLHAYYNVGLRYQVTSAGLIFLQEVALTGNNKQELIDAAAWVFAQHASDHTMLILANHGWGILDPQFNQETQKWEGEYDQMIACPLSTIKRAMKLHITQKHRGYMFNHTTKTYLNNQDMTEALATIKHTILHDTPFDILAFDTCMGSMLEVAYQVAPYAHYLVGSQSCSLTDGFDYQGVMATLNKKNNTPSDVAAGMVRAFDTYYDAHDTSGIYTHAALDLRKIDPVCQAIDILVPLILALPNSQDLLNSVRDASPRFCMWPMYTDLVAFCTLLDTALHESQDSQISSDLRTAIHSAVQNLQRAVHDMVLARCGGSHTRDVAYGFSIYCPFGSLDSSYQKTVFANSSQWLNLLQKMSDNEPFIL